MADAYPLSSLLDVRVFREDKAKRDVMVAQSQLQAAKAALVRQEDEHRAWVEHVGEETERRYDRLLGQIVHIKDLNDFNQGLADLALKTLTFEMAVAKAKTQVDTCENNVTGATDRAKVARQNTAKIEKHREIWREEEKKLIERIEEREFEDFVPVNKHSDE